MRVILYAMTLICLVCAQPATANIDQLLTSASADTFTAEHILCASIFEQGSDTLVALCRKLEGNMDNERLRTLLQSLAMAAGSNSEYRQAYVSAISQTLPQMNDKYAQDFLMELLDWTEDDACVDALAAFLRDTRLCDRAVRTLTSMHTPKAVAVLKTALADNKTANVSAVISALGALKTEDAAELIMPYATHGDAAMRQSAQLALANIGHAPVASLIAAESAKSRGFAKALADANTLLLARRLADKGQSATAAVMCRDLLRNEVTAVHVQCGALDVLVGAECEKALDDLLAAAHSGTPELAAAAASQANRMEGSHVTRQWLNLLEDADPFTAEHIIAMLGLRGDLGAFDAIAKRFNHVDEHVSGAAMHAAVLLDWQKAMPALINLLKEAEEPWRFTLAINHLMRMPGQDALIASTSQLGTMPQATRIKLMEALAQRHAISCSRYILAQTTECPPIRQAALRALATCAAADDLDAILTRMLAAQDQNEKNSFQQAAITAVLQIEDAEKRVASVLTRLDGASNTNLDLLLRILGRTGSRKGFDVIVIAKANSVSKDAAIRALADWPDVSAVPELMQIVQTEELRYQVIALRSALKLMNESAIDNATRLTYVRQAAQAIRRPEEKRLLISFVGQIRTNEALTLIEPYLSDPQLVSEAALAAAQIALPASEQDRRLTGTTAARVLQKARDAVTDDALKQRIAEYLNAMPSAPEKKNRSRGLYNAV